MDKLQGWKRWWASLAAVSLMALTATAQAAPLFTFTGGSAPAGSQVALRFSGDLNYFLGGDLTLKFDDAFLTWVGIPLPAVSTPSVVGGTATVSMVAAAPGSDLGAGPKYDYFDVLFLIKAGSTGSTSVTFSSAGLGSNVYFDDATGGSSYDIAGLGARITVQPAGGGGDLPVGSSSVLVLSGLGLMAVARRRNAAA